MLRVAVDIGSDAIRLDFVFEHVGERLCAMDGVDEGIEEVGHIVATFLQLSHNVPHGAVSVLSAVFANADGVVHNVTRRGLRVFERGRKQLYDFVLAIDKAVVCLAHNALFLSWCSDIG